MFARRVVPLNLGIYIYTYFFLYLYQGLLGNAIGTSNNCILSQENVQILRNYKLLYANKRIILWCNNVRIRLHSFRRRPRINIPFSMRMLSQAKRARCSLFPVRERLRRSVHESGTVVEAN